MKNVLKVCVVAACFSAIASAAMAQQIVHALSGTVKSVNPKIKTTQIETDNGTSGYFEWLKKTDTDINFDKSVKADTTDAAVFTTKGAQVIAYFIGDGQIRTIIAVHDLGSGSLKKTSGTVVKFSRKDHLLAIKNSAGVEETFHLDAKTVADTTTGVEEGFKFDFSKGDNVLVTAAQSNGSDTALLIAPGRVMGTQAE